MVNLKSPVFLFVGDEKHLKEKALEDLKSSLLDRSSKELDYKVFYAHDANAPEIFDYVSTMPFSSSKRLAVVKDFDDFPPADKDRFISYIKKPSKHACLVLEMEDDSFIKDESGIEQHVSVVRFGEQSGPQTASWIRKFVIAAGISIEDDAVDSLVELKGNDLLLLTQEIGKLLTFIGDRRNITADDVEDLVGRSLISSAFDIAWAIGEKNVDKAMGLVGDLALSGKKPHEIVGILCWHLKRLLKAKILKDRGETDYAIGSVLRVAKRYSRDFFMQVGSASIEEIRSKMEILLEADLDIKNSRFSSQVLIEIAIIKLCL